MFIGVLGKMFIGEVDYYEMMSSFFVGLDWVKGNPEVEYWIDALGPGPEI